MSNPPRTAEEKDAQREAARARRRQMRPCPARVNRRRDAFAVACQQVGLRYKPIPAPRTKQDALGVCNPLTAQDHYVRRHCPVSWEVMTERGEYAGV